MTVVERAGTAIPPGPGSSHVPAAPGSMRTWTRPAPAVDPISLFAAAREQDLEAALWLQPSAGFAIGSVSVATARSTFAASRSAVDRISSRKIASFVAKWK